MINQDAFFSVSKLEEGKSIEYNINMKDNGAYLHCAAGVVEIDNKLLNADDAIGIYEADSFSTKVVKAAELIFVEIPMQRGIKI